MSIDLTTPGVYIEEVSTIPSTIVRESATVPIFVGHTRVHHGGKTFNMGSTIPTAAYTVGSVAEYIELFGVPGSGTFDIEVTDTFDAQNVRLTRDVSITPSKYIMFYAIQHYFANGGGPCKVISCADMNIAPSASRFSAAFDTMETLYGCQLLVIPEMTVGDSTYKTTVDLALAHCRKVGNRFLLIDAPYTGDAVADAASMRTNSGTENLSHGAAYYPFLQTNIKHDFDERMVRIKHEVSGGTATATLDEKNVWELKALDNGLYNEPRVHYYHMGEEVWKAAETWPPAGVEMQSLYFAADSSLSTQKPVSEGQYDDFVLDTTTYVGLNSRWELSTRCPSTYDTLLMQVDDLLSYAGPVATDPLDITGVPEVGLWLASPEPDGACFVYLMDESPEGKLSVMSQGHLRFIHRAETQTGAPYKDHLPYRSFLSSETMDMPIGEPTELHFGLSPISWQLKPGHRVRVLLCGSDRSHFSLVGPQPFTAKLMRSREFSSRIELPILRKGNR